MVQSNTTLVLSAGDKQMYEIKLMSHNRCFAGEVESTENLKHILDVFSSFDYAVYKDDKLIKLHQHDLRIIKPYK